MRKITFEDEILHQFKRFAALELEALLFVFKDISYSKRVYFERTWKHLFDTLVNRANEIYEIYKGHSDIDRSLFTDHLQLIVEDTMDKYWEGLVR